MSNFILSASSNPSELQIGVDGAVLLTIKPPPGSAGKRRRVAHRFRERGE